MLRFLLLSLLGSVSGKLQPPLDKFNWLLGTWRSEFGGDVEWPTIPPMKYGEEITFGEGDFSHASGTHFVNMTPNRNRFSSIAWSHNTKDHFHNEYAYLTTDRFGNVMYFGAGNNGFLTVEEGTITRDRMNIQSVHVGRVDIARELPVESIRREFALMPNGYMEQRLFMRTLTHPLSKNQDRIHATILYQRVE